jgi:hypothetical protein
LRKYHGEITSALVKIDLQGGLYVDIPVNELSDSCRKELELGVSKGKKIPVAVLRPLEKQGSLASCTLSQRYVEELRRRFVQEVKQGSRFEARVKEFRAKSGCFIVEICPGITARLHKENLPDAVGRSGKVFIALDSVIPVIVQSAQERGIDVEVSLDQGAWLASWQKILQKRLSFLERGSGVEAVDPVVFAEIIRIRNDQDRPVAEVSYNGFTGTVPTCELSNRCLGKPEDAIGKSIPVVLTDVVEYSRTFRASQRKAELIRASFVRDVKVGQEYVGQVFDYHFHDRVYADDQTIAGVRINIGHGMLAYLPVNQMKSSLDAAIKQRYPLGASVKVLVDVVEVEHKRVKLLESVKQLVSC